MICTDNSGYDGHFSIIYNNSCNNFNLITDFSFTQNPRRSTNQEGIEDEVMADKMREAGCDFLQGFLYSKPISVDEFIEKYS